MIQLETDIEGKQAYFGKLQGGLKELGFGLSGSWQYDEGYFDGILSREGAETIYLRLPFHVISGELDNDHALLEFDTPFLIKHVVNTGLEKEGSDLATATGLSQFQKPVDADGEIDDRSYWQKNGEHAVQQIINHIDNNL
ncbi:MULTISPECIES: YugN family protein [Oceanobacillus]|uniref:YugN-like family protein n=1 Tax=Oceanobacillus kimchii TaxID=746691 RepID=A0ABQ5THR8_9BACI|nr:MULTISPECIES: YugN family protein [Oceanobacillus]MBT2653004.1 hypothetical protein [Oceanobacillus sp. ISL-73]MCT1577607.1 YugN-like family protein [Oceanobacillus kimchii]MCT2136595.1 YugN-like family protein [Oceanobacillus kimchii]OEH53736.1 hypothetical protein AQ616_14745 [Oceanobacillus sp. E9]GLO64675.1 hypothetical protein MACH08_04590 [Oceanobacillus kimchii]